jgi:hypothetical protein
MPWGSALLQILFELIASRLVPVNLLPTFRLYGN